MDSKKERQSSLNWDRICIPGSHNRHRGHTDHGNVKTHSSYEPFFRVLLSQHGQDFSERESVSIPLQRLKTVRDLQTIFSPKQWTRTIVFVLTLFGLLHSHTSAQSTAGRKVRRMITAVPPGATVKLNCLLPKDETVSSHVKEMEDFGQT